MSKDKDTEEEVFIDEEVVEIGEFEQRYFNIQSGEFSGRSLPDSNSSSLEILQITGNSTVLAGGSNIVGVTASENSTAVIVGVEGQADYFTLSLQPDDSGRVQANLQLLIGQQAEENFNIAFAAIDGEGNYGDYKVLEVNIMEAGTGLLQVSLSWDQENDVDLHVIEPNGEHIYFGSRNSIYGGQLDVDSNPACNIDNINNEDDPEVSIENGEYEVLVNLWANCEIDSDTNYTIIVYYGGEIIATTEGVNPHSGILTSVDESGNTNLISVMKFIIDGEPADRNVGNRNLQSAPKAYKFSHDKNNKVFKNFSPIKK